MDTRMALRVEEAAALVGISRSKGYELASSGVWPCVRLGRSVRIPVADLEKWLETAQCREDIHPQPGGRR